MMITREDAQYLEKKFAQANANLERSAEEIFTHHETYWWEVLRDTTWEIIWYGTVFSYVIEASAHEVFELFSLWVHPDVRWQGLWKKLFASLTQAYQTSAQIVITENDLVVALWNMYGFTPISKKELPTALITQLEWPWALKDSYMYLVNDIVQTTMIQKHTL